MNRVAILLYILGIAITHAGAQRSQLDFNQQWKFRLGDLKEAIQPGYVDKDWRILDLPHDWSIEGSFSKEHPATEQGGALPGGVGYYRKKFSLPLSAVNKRVRILFDGVYRNSEVWINGHLLGKRPNGYISFSYDLTGHLFFGDKSNEIVVRVDNSQQPNSRWYSGSGIYRDVRLLITEPIAVAAEGSCVTTPRVSTQNATVHLLTTIEKHSTGNESLLVESVIFTAEKRQVARQLSTIVLKETVQGVEQSFEVKDPRLWSTDRPYLYTIVTTIRKKGQVLDTYTTPFGIRYFSFDATKGFSLNGKNMKVLGVCMHHDLGALGAAVNTAAMARQLRILKEMGCNAIRTAHNPPARELLDLCDRMGFLVMDEAFDMWRKKKNRYDYSLDFPEWHKQDLEDQVRRDRNHPSVFMWSIGNEIREQFDSTGISLGKELVGIIKSLDTTRPVTSALSEPDPKKNFIYQSGALDVVGLNYHIETYGDFPKNYPGQKFIGAENMSALATRGHYDMPSDSMRFWPQSSKYRTVENGNPDYTVSAYDHVAAYWGSSHEATWKLIKKYDFLSGLFVWSGFDFLGEPVPYAWPARSAYYGIVDLAGFPKDVYYMYQSEWTNTPVLHIFPHWNWTRGQLVDVWAYYNQADEVELFLNGRSLGTRKKQDEDLHVMWRVPFEPGKLVAISRKNGKTLLEKELRTAEKPARLQLTADRNIIHADGKDLSFITVEVQDSTGQSVPDAVNDIQFEVKGNAKIAAVDNGSQSSHELFQSSHRKAYNGKALLIIRAEKTPGIVHIRASAAGMLPAEITIRTN